MNCQNLCENLSDVDALSPSGGGSVGGGILEISDQAGSLIEVRVALVDERVPGLVGVPQVVKSQGVDTALKAAHEPLPGELIAVSAAFHERRQIRHA